MNLETATPQQREVITTLDKPLMVSAGAGSGKTFTLTQRVVYALLPQGEKREAYLKSVDEILATTFTKKAAAELTSRIKAHLLAEGLIDEALKIDTAWISTIHGICSKILREHAFTLGIDPSFEVIAEEDARCLMNRAFDETINQAKEAGRLAVLKLIDEYGLRGTRLGFGVFEMVQLVIDKALATREGFDSFLYCDEGANPSGILRQMMEWGEAFVEVARSWKKPTKTDGKHLQAMQEALVATQEYGALHPALSFDDDSFDATSYLEVFYSFPKTSPQYRKKKEDAEFFEAYRSTYAQLSLQAEQAIGTVYAHTLAGLSAEVYERYQALKGSSLLDNTDLLRRTVEAFDTHPEIAQRYQERFNLIMIDEFQDTDQLQVALLESLLHADGSNLCTVGDAQQSIYRFRGADVSVFYEFRDKTKESYKTARFVNLPDNFRSHKDILQFVDHLFSTPQFFGSDFLSLKPRSAVNIEKDDLFEEEPRVQMQVLDVQSPATKTQGRLRSAATIAQYFSRLREKGASPEDMVILLGSMTNAHCYAEALRQEGFESVIAGGSVFARASEVVLLSDLLHVCINPHDSLSLYRVLSSDLFAISDSTLLVLATGEEEGKIKKQNIASGFLYASVEALGSISEQERIVLHHAQACLTRFCNDSVQRGIARAATSLFISTGYFSWLEERGAEGLAIAGNIYKALDMIAEFEETGMGPSLVSFAFDEKLKDSKEAPGSLSTSTSSFVRIMTVHASKGLEFPFVALAEISSGVAKDSAFYVEASHGTTQILLKPKLSSSQVRIAKELKSLILDDEEALSRSRAQNSFVSLQYERATKELDEAKRLLYVALTRASKSLFVSFVVEGNGAFDYSKKGIIDDLKTVLRWNNEDAKQYIDYGGTTPLALNFVSLQKRSEEDAQGQAVQERIYEVREPFEISHLLGVYRDRGHRIVSYSSLAREQKTERDAYGLGVDRLSLDCSSQDNHHNIYGDGLVCTTRDDALEFGIWFHRLAQKFILESLCQSNRLTWLASLDDEYFSHLVGKRACPFPMRDRLRQAFVAWMHSEDVRALFSCDRLDAEVPFMLELSEEEGGVFLEGELDALGIRLDTEAFFIDYKTGGAYTESEEQLYQKHLLQASCYSYALLREGCKRVTATFVRVDFLNQEKLGCVVSNRGQHPCVTSLTYSFSAEDTESLRETILHSYRSQD